MLILSRKKNEEIVIGDDIRITVIEGPDRKIRLGIESPQQPKIHRSELLLNDANRKPLNDPPQKPPVSTDTQESQYIWPQFRTREHYSCFLSYSRHDQTFAQKFHARLKSAGISIWFDEDDIKGGKKTHTQIGAAIREAEKLLLVLSEQSIQSDWVRTELRWARRAEAELGGQKLFPIRLLDFQRLKKWECIDGDSGRDLAAEIREYFIPDFSDWEADSTFETKIQKLIADLTK
jgi:carbon storage regulator CsrA